MISTKDYDWWVEQSNNPVAAVRSLADWLADTLAVVRIVGVVGAVFELADSADGSAYRHTEQAYAALAGHVTGGTATSEVIPSTLTLLLELAKDRNAVLEALADEFGQILYMLNIVSGGEGLDYLASSEEGTAYWHAQRAHTAMLTLLTGDAKDGRRLHDLWSDNHENTAWNRSVLAQQKRSESVIVTVAADGDTATVTLPNGLDCKAGRVYGDSGLFWVTDEEDKVVGTAPVWMEIGRALADHYHYDDEDTPVLVEYATQEQDANR